MIKTNTYVDLRPIFFTIIIWSTVALTKNIKLYLIVAIALAIILWIPEIIESITSRIKNIRINKKLFEKLKKELDNEYIVKFSVKHQYYEMYDTDKQLIVCIPGRYNERYSIEDELFRIKGILKLKKENYLKTVQEIVHEVTFEDVKPLLKRHFHIFGCNYKHLEYCYKYKVNGESICKECKENVDLSVYEDIFNRLKMTVNEDLSDPFANKYTNHIIDYSSDSVENDKLMRKGNIKYISLCKFKNTRCDFYFLADAEKKLGKVELIIFLKYLLLELADANKRNH